jgi:hypothetical protein
MLKTLPLPELNDLSKLDEFLEGRNVRLASNQEIPPEDFHKLVYSPHGVILKFHPKLTQADETGKIILDKKGMPDFLPGKPINGHFRHGMFSPLSDDTRIFPETPMLVLVS